MSTGPQLRAISATTKLGDSRDLRNAITKKKTSWGDWKSVCFSTFAGVPESAGVYCFVYPLDRLPESRRKLYLSGRTFGGKGKQKHQLRIAFSYELRPFRFARDFGVLYVGKASNLRKRLKLHRSPSPKSTTNQVLKGLAGRFAKSYQNQIADLEAHGYVWYLTVESDDERKFEERKDKTKGARAGKGYAADRDLLEIMLIAEYAPPFNLKAER